MKYMLTLIGEERRLERRHARGDEGREMAALGRVHDRAREAGAFVAGEGLQPSATATTVRIGDDDERIVTDGPFAETKEQLGGFYLIDVRRPRRGARVGEEDADARRRGRGPAGDGLRGGRRLERARAAERGALVADDRGRSSTACSGASRGGRSRP